jgi:hypothetical protein
MQADPEITRSDMLVGPSVCCNVPGFGVYDVLGAGFLSDFVSQLKYFSIQHYFLSKFSFFPYHPRRSYLTRFPCRQLRLPARDWSG